MQITETLTQKHIQELYDLYKKHWWCNNRDLEQVRQCVKHSSINIAILDNNKLIGYARILTDFVFKALIFDVIVDEKYQNQGLGKTLVEYIKHHQKLQNVQHFELYCLPEMKDFYNKYGFNAIKDITLLRFTNE